MEFMQIGACDGRQLRRCPLRTALSIVAGRPVSIQSPARNRPAHGRRRAGPRRLPGRERERRARLADDRAARAVRGRARDGSASSSSSCARAISSSLRPAQRRRPRRSTRATDATPTSPNDLSLVEHPLHRAPGQADERLVEHRAIEPEVDGHDRRRRHLRARSRTVSRAAPGRPSNRLGEAQTRAPRTRRPAPRTDRRAARHAQTPVVPDARSCAGAPVLHVAAVALRCTRAPARRTSVAAAWSEGRSRPRADRARTSPRAPARTPAPRPATAAD